MGIKLELNNYFFVGSAIIFFHLFYIQIFNFQKNNKLNCLKIFKSNNLLGFIILINTIVGKI